MAIAHDETLICPRCHESAEAGRAAGQITIVADWETVSDDRGDTISPALLPVIVTVDAATTDEAIQAASNKLQAHFGSEVDELYAKDIHPDEWFGLNETDAFLRICAAFVGAPAVAYLDDDGMNTVIR